MPRTGKERVESHRFVRAARTFAGVVELFEGDAVAALDWFLRPRRALGGVTPLAHVSTESGAREVKALVGRLEHGIPS